MITFTNKRGVATINSVLAINYRTKAAYEAVRSVTCPRCASDVFSLGVYLQYCIRAKYLELAELNQGEAKINYQRLAEQHLQEKNALQKIAKFELNRLLAYYYDHGGPVMEPPLSEQRAKKINPLFNHFVTLFIDQLDDIFVAAYERKIKPDELDLAVRRQTAGLYDQVARLIPIDEIKDALGELTGAGQLLLVSH